MKINKLDVRASQDITIDELPKQDNPNNSDLVIIQGASLTEATSIQQLRNKILGGEAQLKEDLGIYIYSATKINNNDYLLMDGTQYSKVEYPDFYMWLTTKSQDIKLTFSLDTNAETFRLPNYQDTSPVIGNEDANFYNLVDRFVTGRNPDLRVGISPVYCYIKVKFEYTSGVIASPFIKSDGTVAMNNDYIPTDPLDVATKKYIDNKFLNYEIPLSFSINDIGKRVPYYKNAETNPVLIALDGTKYLIADYPDFDYANQEGFTNDGVYFWYNVFNLEILPTIATSYNYDYEINGYIRFNVTIFPITFNSKLVYNFLQTTEGQKLLVADGPGKDKDNFGFTILDANNYQIRMNTNSNFATRLISTGVGAQSPNILGALNVAPTNTGNVAITEGRYLLKIKPDYMVAKIQQVGSGAGGGDLKSDRSVLLTGSGEFNSKQIVAMNDLTSQNIIVGDSAKALITLDTKLVEIDNSILTITNNIGSVNISNLQNQVNTNTSDIADIKTVNSNQDSTIASLQSQVNSLLTKLNSYDTKYRNFTERRLKSGLSVSVSSSATNLTNLTQYFINSQSPTITSFGSSISGLPLGAIGLIEVGSGVSQGFKFPNINGIVNCNLTFSTRITGTISGTVGTPRELIVYIRRVSDNSIVANGGLIKINDNNFNARNVITPSFIQGANDPFLSGGFYLNMLNNSGATLTISAIELLIQGY